MPSRDIEVKAAESSGTVACKQQDVLVERQARRRFIERGVDACTDALPRVRGLTAPAPGSETITEARVVRVPVNGDPVKTVVDFPFEEIGGVSMTPDGRRFVCAVYTARSDVWVVDNFDASP
jgi:hypothetical protein